jgi:hypothetical protein
VVLPWSTWAMMAILRSGRDMMSSSKFRAANYIMVRRKMSLNL